MAKKKRSTLPKNFDELIKAGDIAALKTVFETCELDARGGYSKQTALSFFQVPDELVRWLVEQGADINAVDRYQCTALHEQSGMWCGNVTLLLELGADIEVRDYQNETPLHHAATRFQVHAVQALIAHGANVHAENSMRWTPLRKALAACRNMDIENVVEVAACLIDAKASVTEEIVAEVQRIGKDFEFHREKFNKDSLAETEAALLRLYELFGVTPVVKRRMHDGVSQIEVTATGWEAQHAELWDFLVPSQGSAPTVQGEVIRITGRVAYEILDNGGANWDRDYRKMLDALVRHLASGIPLEADALKEVSELVALLRGGDGDNDEVLRLNELAVRWVLANPNPTSLEPPAYRR
ncbi:hypothetical protein AGMMS49545_00820 [Betaproteobacteria bacterium]|nr:hypothetical protein AGMMS49545_00820 [Betaproteobacteria bacterium]GHU40609.1 hypothetical protein AGMMS50289_02410 [Betaproteobacteria bacterium]